MGSQSSASVKLISHLCTLLSIEMSDPFPEIKSKHSLVAKYVTEPIWEKLNRAKTATSGFSLAKAIACAVEFHNQHGCKQNQGNHQQGSSSPLHPYPCRT